MFHLYSSGQPASDLGRLSLSGEVQGDRGPVQHQRVLRRFRLPRRNPDEPQRQVRSLVNKRAVTSLMETRLKEIKIIETRIFFKKVKLGSLSKTRIDQKLFLKIENIFFCSNLKFEIWQVESKM